MVQFLPLDVTDEDSVGVVLSHLDNAIQYGEHEEPKEPADVSRRALPSLSLDGGASVARRSPRRLREWLADADWLSPVHADGPGRL